MPFISHSKKLPKLIKTSLAALIAISLSSTALMTSMAQASDGDTKSAEIENENIAADASKFGSYLAARIAAFDNENAISADLFKQALALNPDNLVLMRNLLLSRVSNGEFESSIDLANKIQKHPDVALAENFISLTDHLLDKKTDQALQVLKEIDPKHADTYLHHILDEREFKYELFNPLVFAALAIKNNDGVKAKRELSKISKKDLNLLHEIAKESQPIITEFIISAEAIKARSYDRAINQLAANHGSSNLDYLLSGIMSAWAHMGKKDAKTALKTIDALKGPKWFAPFVSLHRGYILAANGQDNEAITELKKAVDDVSGIQVAEQAYADTIIALAEAYAREGFWEDAQFTLENGIARYNGYAPMRALHKEVLAKKKLPVSISTPQQGVAKIFLNIGTAIDRDESADVALIYLNLSRALAAKDDETIMELAQHYDAKNAVERANEYYELIEKSSSFHRVAQLEIALNYDQLEQKAKAGERFKALIAQEPEDLIGYLAYAATLARDKEYNAAAKIYDDAIAQIDKKESHHWNVFYRRGIAYERTDQWDKAEKDFLTALELYPNQPNVLNYLGYTWIDKGLHLDKGLKMIQRAVDQRPNSGFIIDSLGWAYYKLGIYGKAATYLERALELEPADPTIQDHLGDAYWHISRKVEAGFQWNHALALDPDDELRQKIEQKLKDGLDAVEKKQTAKPSKEPAKAQPDEKSRESQDKS